MNKADRLGEADRARVLASVREGLAESKLASWSEPLLFSARRALAGKLGDAAALGESGWSAVDAMLESQFVARSAELKERALRRRASAIVATMGRAAARAAEDERARDEQARAKIDAVARAAARIDRDAETIAARIAEGLARPASAWTSETRIVHAGRARTPHDGLAQDASLARYRVDRALAHLARPLAASLAGAADGTGLGPSELAPLARATTRAFAASAPPNSEGATSLVPLARSAVASLVEHLVALASSPPPPPRAAGLVGELHAFAAALAGP